MPILSRIAIACCVLAAWSVRAPGFAQSQGAPPDPAAKPASSSFPFKPAPGEPIYVLIKSPDQLDRILKGLETPDYVIRDGREHEQWLEALRKQGHAAASRVLPASAVIVGVRALGKVGDDQAALTVEYRIQSADDAMTWVAIRLDGRVLSAVREGDQPLPVRYDAKTGWEAGLSPSGPSRDATKPAVPRERVVQADLLVPVRPASDGRRLELALPEAASMSLDLEIAGAVATASLDDSQRLPMRPIPAAEGKPPSSRITAEFSPRSKLSLDWTLKDNSAAGPGASSAGAWLSVNGQVAAELDGESCRTSASFIVLNERGACQELRLALDAAETLQSLEIEGQASAFEAEPARDGVIQIKAALPNPLRRGMTARVVLRTRRTVKPDNQGRFRLTLRGTRFFDAPEQDGFLTIFGSDGLWVHGESPQGLRPAEARPRASDDASRRQPPLLSYRYEQPYEIILDAFPEPTRLNARSMTQIALNSAMATVKTRLTYQVAQGRIFEVRVQSPPELALESVGPEEIVKSYEWDADADASGARSLRILLKPKARVDREFVLDLVGRQNLRQGEPAANVGLFRPSDAIFIDGQAAVACERGLLADPLGDAPAANPSPRFVWAGWKAPENWPWPTGRAAPGAPPPWWVRYGEAASRLPLRLTALPRVVEHETIIRVRLDRRMMDVEQETICRIDHGALSQLRIAVPQAFDNLWILEGVTLPQRERIGENERGESIYKLTFDREMERRAVLRFKARAPIAGFAAVSDPERSGGQTLGLDETPRTLRIPWIRALDGSTKSVRIEMRSEIGIEGKPAADSLSDWRGEINGSSPMPGGGVSAGLAAELGFGDDEESDGRPLRFAMTAVAPENPGAPPLFTAKAKEQTALPKIVAPRLWIQTMIAADGSARRFAHYRLESRGASLDLRLPAGERLERVLADGAPIATVETVKDQPDVRSITLPSGASFVGDPMILTLESSIEAGRADAAWEPPRLLNGVVQQTYWEVRLSGSEALIAGPKGWTSENRWLPSFSGWIVQPWRTTAELASWLDPDSPPAPPSAAVTERERDRSRVLLFSRLGSPEPLRPYLVSRYGLVGVCSMIIIAIGVLAIQRPRSLPVALAVLAQGFALLYAIVPSLALMTFQASIPAVLAMGIAIGVSVWLRRRSAWAQTDFSGAGPSLVPGPSNPSGTGLPTLAPAPAPAPAHAHAADLQETASLDAAAGLGLGWSPPPAPLPAEPNSDDPTVVRPRGDPPSA